MRRDKIALVIGLVCVVSAVLLLQQMVKPPGPEEWMWQWIGIRYNNDQFSDPDLQQQLAAAGWQAGEESCMYLCKLAYLQEYPEKQECINATLTGYTQQSWANAAGSKCLQRITNGRPQKGDIAIWRNNEDPQRGHAAIVVRQRGGNNWEIVEGNHCLYGDRQIIRSNRVLIPGRVGEQFTLLGFLRIKN